MDLLLIWIELKMFCCIRVFLVWQDTPKSAPSSMLASWRIFQLEQMVKSSKLQVHILAQGHILTELMGELYCLVTHKRITFYYEWTGVNCFTSQAVCKIEVLD